MNDVEKIFHEAMMRNTFCETVADDSSGEFIDGIAGDDYIGPDNMDHEADETSSSSEEI